MATCKIEKNDSVKRCRVKLSKNRLTKGKSGGSGAAAAGRRVALMRRLADVAEAPVPFHAGCGRGAAAPGVVGRRHRFGVALAGLARRRRRRLAAHQHLPM